MRRKFCRNSMACSWKRVVLLPLPLWILLCYLLYQSTTGPVGSRSDLFRLRNNKRGNWDTSSTIHLGFVLRGERVFLRAVTLLKNIFYYQGRINDPSGSCVVRNYGSSGHVCRKEPIPGFNPVHVHIVADNETRKMAHSCFTNASLPAFSWSLYDITPYLSFVEEFPNGHDTGPSAMVKITWPFILEKDVDRFITLDTDTLFNHNIAELWSYFDRFNDEQVLGLAYEATASSAYFQPDAQHPYADGGLNSGVILWYMKRIRLLPWEQLVRTGVLLQLREHSTLNGDQGFQFSHCYMGRHGEGAMFL
ncbi:unnamed protein product [Calicophoron daubneyi]|uniref:Glycosyltransferase family 92 protein n=1 Tax=Calicophoron daubneyi TaxID=300641 RepID=A0AAV2TD27_CALDB